jgi:hypothetical protein
MQTLSHLPLLLALLISIVLCVPASIFMWKQFVKSKQNGAYRAVTFSFVAFILLIVVGITFGVRLVLLMP